MRRDKQLMNNFQAFKHIGDCTQSLKPFKYNKFKQGHCQVL